MRLILALSIALGTANLLFVPAETGLDRMTSAADSTREHVASAPRARARGTLRSASMKAALDGTPAVTHLDVREAGATPSARPTGFAMHSLVDSANSTDDDVTTAEAQTSIVVR